MIVFVDLDETLVHTMVLSSYDEATIKSLVNDGYLLQRFSVPHLTKVRPFAAEFLQKLSAMGHEVCLFTNGNDFYADAILNYFDLRKYFIRAYARQSSHLIKSYERLFIGEKSNFRLVDDALIDSETFKIKESILGCDLLPSYINVKAYDCEENDYELLMALSKV